MRSSEYLRTTSAGSALDTRPHSRATDTGTFHHSANNRAGGGSRPGSRPGSRSITPAGQPRGASPYQQQGLSRSLQQLPDISNFMSDSSGAEEDDERDSLGDGSPMSNQSSSPRGRGSAFRPGNMAVDRAGASQPSSLGTGSSASHSSSGAEAYRTRSSPHRTGPQSGPSWGAQQQQQQPALLSPASAGGLATGGRRNNMPANNSSMMVGGLPATNTGGPAQQQLVGLAGTAAATTGMPHAQVFNNMLGAVVPGQQQQHPLIGSVSSPDILVGAAAWSQQKQQQQARPASGAWQQEGSRPGQAHQQQHPQRPGHAQQPNALLRFTGMDEAELDMLLERAIESSSTPQLSRSTTATTNLSDASTNSGGGFGTAGVNSLASHSTAGSIQSVGQAGVVTDPSGRLIGQASRVAVFPPSTFAVALSPPNVTQGPPQPTVVLQVVGANNNNPGGAGASSMLPHQQGQQPPVIQGSYALPPAPAPRLPADIDALAWQPISSPTTTRAVMGSVAGGMFQQHQTTTAAAPVPNTGGYFNMAQPGQQQPQLQQYGGGQGALTRQDLMYGAAAHRGAQQEDGRQQ